MARNRDIVATRKLNDNNKAKLGRGGDTKIRTVDGKKSHVNAFEAYLIDVKGKAGQEYTKKVGSGTINPYTGMPEYYEPKELDYDELLGLGGTDLSEQYAAWGLSDAAIASMGSFGAKEELGFAGETQALALSGAETTKGFTEKGLGLAQAASTRQADIATAGITAGITGTREALGRQFTAGSKDIGRGMAQARAGAELTMAQSDFAFSGSATGALDKQMKSLTQDYGQLQADYSGGITAATRQADIGLAGVRAGQKTAAETYQLGMEEASADYEATIAGADLDYRKAVHGIKDIETEKFYGKLAEYGGESRDYVLHGSEGRIRRILGESGQKQIFKDGEWVDATDGEYDAAYAG